ncbi:MULTISPECIES: proline/glycine betaine ABC transporter permease [Oleiagrimonas]|uniref:Proline/glycine betaine ABC transporter permease n=1 Tax=Oleiagrimonas citrea TaxID=1665687 RepID=A0A846ZJR9_9GAMM|nr:MULTISPECIES: proline/glycine betaine ABC transporter permease [Oleiagrimonas]NKZ38052.1 proline/glycine betaine ABC transporter permease [Oleiagrimonas citrea]RAP56250.1 ABC transporter permease [Oleiagrimonas sp. MCCC 1A03011]
MIPSVPKFPLAHGIDVALDWLTHNFSWLTQALSHAISAVIDAIVAGLLFVPPWLLIIIVAAVGWRVAGRRVGIFTALGLLFLWNLRLWQPTVETFTLVLISTLIAVAIGLPLGIAAALNKRTSRIVMPVLDFMQTMPAFVYLIPAIPFFGLGAVSASVATVIFSTPPTIRLTALGIRQVPGDLIEAADAFGSSRKQKLFKVQLPMAVPTIMAGINQTIMLALSMVVIAAMIGAGGLGGEVWEAIQRLEPGKGFESGIAIVILAMILDRITQRIGRDSKVASAH